MLLLVAAFIIYHMSVLLQGQDKSLHALSQLSMHQIERLRFLNCLVSMVKVCESASTVLRAALTSSSGAHGVCVYTAPAIWSSSP